MLKKEGGKTENARLFEEYFFKFMTKSSQNK